MNIEVPERSAVSADTNAILLLCATLGKRSADAPAPLSASEYDALTDVLRGAGLRPAALLHSSEDALKQLTDGLSPKFRAKVNAERLYALLGRGGQLAIAMTRWSSAGVWVCSRADSQYPSRYKDKLGRSAPPIVYGVGVNELLQRGGLAVVGSRKPDSASEDYAVTVGRWAASEGVQIVSGAASGVDATAMLACTDAGGTAVGVVADALLRLSTRKDFREAILERRLCLISSFHPEAAFSVGNAMARNRWIYALADRGLVVACSEERGGTWAGAVDAIKRGVTVYVKTGNPARPGNEALVVQGALPVPADLRAMLQDAPQRATESSGDKFSSIAPAILSLLEQPRTSTEVAKTLNLLRKQVTTWLRRLVDEGKVVKQGTKFRRLDTKEPTQSTLFS